MGFGSNKGFTPGTDAGGGGDVSGPGASTDHAIARWDGVNGDTLLDSVVTIADNGEVVIAPTAGAFDALHIDKDDASILLGDAGHIKIIHGAHYTSSAGITLARINTGGGSPMNVAIETRENAITAGDALGSLFFISRQGGTQHTAENQPAAGFTAVAENTFSANLNATSLSFKTATTGSATEKMRLTHSGSLGIGTSAPASQFHISGTTAKQVITLENNGAKAEIGVAYGGGDIIQTSAKGDLVISNETNGKDILFGIGSGAGSQKMIIDGAGNVGIGNFPAGSGDPPEAKLEISGSGNLLRLAAAESDGSPSMIFTQNGSPGTERAKITYQDTTAYAGNIFELDSDGGIALLASNGPDGIYIKSDGKVGVGVNDPDSHLEVFGTGNQLKLSYDASNYADFYVDSTGDLFLTSSGGDSTFSAASSLSLKKNGDTFLEIDSGNGANSNRRFQLKSHGLEPNGLFSIGKIGGTEILSIKANNSRVGINETAPSASFHVAGDIENHFADAPAAGSGWTPATENTTFISKVNGEIVTTIQVSLNGLACSGTIDKAVIGNMAGTPGAYLTQITTAKNGIVYKAEMMCVETPAGGNNEPDIDLVTSDQNNLRQGFVYDGGGTSKLVISAAADYVAGMRKESAAGEDLSGLVDDYVYLAVGNGAGADGGYSAGKFVIKLYGASF